MEIVLHAGYQVDSQYFLKHRFRSAPFGLFEFLRLARMAALRKPHHNYEKLANGS